MTNGGTMEIADLEIKRKVIKQELSRWKTELYRAQLTAKAALSVGNQKMADAATLSVKESTGLVEFYTKELEQLGPEETKA